MAKKQRINGRLKASGQIIVLECDGNGRTKVLEKMKGFRQPAFWFIQCKGCAKCERHLTPFAPDAAPELRTSEDDTERSAGKA